VLYESLRGLEVLRRPTDGVDARLDARVARGVEAAHPENVWIESLLARLPADA
jgi:hypothetical protein